jgi:hypothetical protein
VTRDAAPSSSLLLNTVPHGPATRPLPAARRREGHQCACPEPSRPPNSATANRRPHHADQLARHHPCPTGLVHSAASTPTANPGRGLTGRVNGGIFPPTAIARSSSSSKFGWVTAFPAAIKGPAAFPTSPRTATAEPLSFLGTRAPPPRAPSPPVRHRPRTRLCTPSQPKVGGGIDSSV